MQNNVYDQIKGSLTSIRIEKPAAIILELTGPILTKAFTDDSMEAKSFIRKNVKRYVRKNYGHRELRVDTNFLRLETERQHREAVETRPSSPISTMASPGSNMAGLGASTIASSMVGGSSHSQQRGLSNIASGIPKEKTPPNLPPLIADERRSHRKQISTTIDNIIWRIDHGDRTKPLSSVTAFYLHM